MKRRDAIKAIVTSGGVALPQRPQGMWSVEVTATPDCDTSLMLQSNLRIPDGAFADILRAYRVGAKQED